MADVCLDCQRRVASAGRGLCRTCHAIRCRDGTLDERPCLPNSSGMVARMFAAGLTYRRLDYWTTRGWLVADRRSPGSGIDRSWPDAELEVALTMLKLVTAGLTVQAAHDVARGRSELAPGVVVEVFDHEEVPA